MREFRSTWATDRRPACTVRRAAHLVGHALARHARRRHRTECASVVRGVRPPRRDRAARAVRRNAARRARRREASRHANGGRTVTDPRARHRGVLLLMRRLLHHRSVERRAVAANHLAVVARAGLRRPFLRLVVDVHDAEPLGEAEAPFVVVEQAPGEVAAQVGALPRMASCAALMCSR